MMWYLKHPAVEFGFVRIPVRALLASLMDLESNRGQGIVVHMIEPHKIIYLPLQNLVLVRIPNRLPPVMVTVLSLLKLWLGMTKGYRVGETPKVWSLVFRSRHNFDMNSSTSAKSKILLLQSNVTGALLTI